MNKTEVVNCREPGVLTDYYRYIGRGSGFGNPFLIGPHGTRKDVIRKHKHWLLEWIHTKKEIKIGKYSNKWVVEHIQELRGQRLACFCAPLPCHGDFLAELANSLLSGESNVRRQKRKSRKNVNFLH